MVRRMLLFFLIVLSFSSVSLAFDGNRRGFVLGGGLGPAFRSSQNTFYSDKRETEFGYGLSFIIGYSWNEKNMLVWQRDGIIIKRDSSLHMQNLGAFVYYHYFGSPGKSVYINAGLHPFSDYDFIMGGLGYEFVRHYQISTHLWYVGKEKDYQLQISFTAIAY